MLERPADFRKIEARRRKKRRRKKKLKNARLEKVRGLYEAGKIDAAFRAAAEATGDDYVAAFLYLRAQLAKSAEGKRRFIAETAAIVNDKAAPLGARGYVTDLRLGFLLAFPETRDQTRKEAEWLSSTEELDQWRRSAGFMTLCSLERAKAAPDWDTVLDLMIKAQSVRDFFDHSSVYLEMANVAARLGRKEDALGYAVLGWWSYYLDAKYPKWVQAASEQVAARLRDLGRNAVAEAWLAWNAKGQVGAPPAFDAVFPPTWKTAVETALDRRPKDQPMDLYRHAVALYHLGRLAASRQALERLLPLADKRGGLGKLRDQALSRVETSEKTFGSNLLKE